MMYCSFVTIEQRSFSIAQEWAEEAERHSPKGKTPPMGENYLGRTRPYFIGFLGEFAFGLFCRTFSVWADYRPAVGVVAPAEFTVFVGGEAKSLDVKTSFHFQIPRRKQILSASLPEIKKYGYADFYVKVLVCEESRRANIIGWANKTDLATEPDSIRGKTRCKQVGEKAKYLKALRPVGNLLHRLDKGDLTTHPPRRPG